MNASAFAPYNINSTSDSIVVLFTPLHFFMPASHCPEVDSRRTTKYDILKFVFIVYLFVSLYFLNLFIFMFISIFGCPLGVNFETV